jgi:hypothetical protein
MSATTKSITLEELKELHKAAASKGDELSIVLNNVWTKHSIIHGLGIFAKRDILADEVITLFPTHYTIRRSDIAFKDGLMVGLTRDKTITKKRYRFEKDIMDNHMCPIEGEYLFYGDPRVHDPSALGHMINDGLRGRSTNDHFKKKDWMLYNQMAPIANNCYAVNVYDSNNCIAIVATKNIRVEKEILISYGYPFWTTYNTFQDKEEY